jgi:hypothetical protein
MADVSNPNDLPQIADNRIKCCSGCGGPCAPGGTFWIATVGRGVMDMRAVNERIGLNLMMGSMALADVFASRPLNRQFQSYPEICVCEACACTCRWPRLS